jgi:uncharacterized membrane protein
MILIRDLRLHLTPRKPRNPRLVNIPFALLKLRRSLGILRRTQQTHHGNRKVGDAEIA